MRRPEKSTDPNVVDLKARRRAAELQKEALKGVRPSRRPALDGPVTAWLILLAAALAWGLVRWLSAGGAL
jgi:hypothetical protein